MENAIERGLDWAGLPVIATVARLLCRELTQQNEYPLLENRTLKSKLLGRLRFTDEGRRLLAEAASAMGRSLMQEVVSIVEPETVLPGSGGWSERNEITADSDAAAPVVPGHQRTSKPRSVAWRGRAAAARSEFGGNCSSWASSAPKAALPTSCAATGCRLHHSAGANLAAVPGRLAQLLLPQSRAG